MALIVQKFGGSSLADPELVKKVAGIIQATRDEGHDVAVVVSAMNGETDRLIELADQISKQPAPREYDALVSSGEQVSAALLSMLLTASGYPARSFNGRQAGIKTNSVHKKSSIIDVNPKEIREDLNEGFIPVITGFQGLDAAGHITTLGRGGSDITAVAIAAALQADECQIYTDVKGVYTTDPRVVKAAQPLTQITFDEMLEMSRLGAKVLQIKSVEYAHKHNVPLRVLSTFEPGVGTLITATLEREVPFVSGIACDKKQAKLTMLGMPHGPKCSADIINALCSASIDVDMLMENVPQADGAMDVSFTVHSDDFSETLAIANNLAQAMNVREVIGDDSIAKLSLVGMGMTSHAGVASTMMHALNEEGINIHSITSSEVTISTIIDEKYLELGVRTLHSIFDLDKAS